MTMRRLRLGLYILAGFWFGGLAAFTLLPAARERLLPSINVRSVGQALVGGPFTLTDQTGKRVTDRTSAASSCWFTSASPTAPMCAPRHCR